MKALTRAEMKRAAMALVMAEETCASIGAASLMFGVRFDVVSVDNPRYRWAYGLGDGHSHCDFIVEASMLLSEAHRPAGHDGDGRDD